MKFKLKVWKCICKSHTLQLFKGEKKTFPMLAQVGGSRDTYI